MYVKLPPVISTPVIFQSINQRPVAIVQQLSKPQQRLRILVEEEAVADTDRQ